MTDFNITYAGIVAPLDVRICPNDQTVLKLITRLAASNPEVDSDQVITRGDITLDKLCRATRLPKPHVFAAVARLEQFGLIPDGRIR